MTFGRLWPLLGVGLPVLASLLAGLSTVDLAYHVRAGQLLLETGRIPTTDPFTFSVAGEPWLNQQWLAQLTFAAVDRAGGWDALAILRAGLVGLTFGLVIRAATIRGASPRAASLLALGAFLVASPALALRPQLLAMALFAGLLLLVEERRRDPRILWLAPVLVAVWANVHGSFVLAPVLLGYAWLEDRTEGRPARPGLVVLVVAMLATLVTPFGAGVWGYAAGLTTNPAVTERVAEWQATSIRTVPGLLFIGSALLVAVLLARRARVTPWPVLLWLGALFVVGVVAVRGIAWWPLAAAVVVAGLLERPAVERVRPDPPRIANRVLAGVLALAIVGLLPVWRAPDPLTGRIGLLTSAPTAATAALRGFADSSDRIFAPQTLGSWLELTVPQARVFVDSRIELFPAQVWADRDAVLEGRDGWPAVLDRWGVTIVLADAAREAGLIERLRATPAWREAYADVEAVIFVRTVASPG